MADNKITCTIQNNLSNKLNLLGNMPGSGSNYGSGEWVTGPENTIDANSSKTAFVIEEKNKMNGSMGYVQYDLGNSYGQLVLMFNCNNGREDYFYALIQGYNQEQLSGPVEIQAHVAGWFSYNPCDPQSYENMTITVTVSPTNI